MPPRGSSSPPREPSPYAPRVSPPPLGSHSPPKALGSPRSGHTAPRPLPPLRGPTSPGAAGRPPPRPATTIPLPPRPATTTPLSPRPATTTPLSPRPATTSPGVRPAPGPAPGSALPRTRSPPTAARQPLRGQPKSLLPVPLRAGRRGHRPRVAGHHSSPRRVPAVVRDRRANSMGEGGEKATAVAAAAATATACRKSHAAKTRRQAASQRASSLMISRKTSNSTQPMHGHAGSFVRILHIPCFCIRGAIPLTVRVVLRSLLCCIPIPYRTRTCVATGLRASAACSGAR